MTTRAQTSGGRPVTREAADLEQPLERGWVVIADDEVDPRIAGHAGVAYTSPPQARRDALALIALLLGGPAAVDGPTRWTRALPGGRRTITLTRCSEDARPAAGGRRSA
jgi:hypothetical protein